MSEYMECPECPICREKTELETSEKCGHSVCDSCWIRIGKTNPVCPFCREDNSEWIRGKYKIKIYDTIDFSSYLNMLPFSTDKIKEAMLAFSAR